MIRITTSGSTKNLEKFLAKVSKTNQIESRIKSLAETGVRALAQATPKDSGLTAASWDYEIVSKKGEINIYWTNSNRNGEAVVAALIQYGHGTGTGGYIQGIDYINPALRPVFDDIANKAWEAVTSA